MKSDTTLRITRIVLTEQEKIDQRKAAEEEEEEDKEQGRKEDGTSC